MRITTRGRYALRAALALAQLGKDGTPISISRLSEKENISSVFLEQIFFRLRKAGLVDSVRGPGGGFKFSKALDEITVKAILDAAGEGLTLSPCGSNREECQHSNDCLSYALWSEATSLVNDYFKNITIGSFIKKHKEKFINTDFHCPD